MKIVYSQWSLGKEPFKEMAACSNRLAQAHGYETILYTDKRGKEDFKNIKFSEVRLFPDLINELPKSIWSLGKLVAISQMDEPFFHVDQDILLYKNVLKNVSDKDFVVLHDETFVHGHTNMYDIRDRLQVRPKELKPDYAPDSYNFAIVGGQKYKELSEATSSVLECCIENKKLLESFDTQSIYMHITIIAEQVWIPNIMMSKNIYPYSILHGDIYQRAKELGVAHLWTDCKKIYKDNIIKYAKKLSVIY